MNCKKKLGVTLTKFEGKFVIVKGYEVYNVNEVSARIFDLCNGDNDLDDIAKKIAGFYEVPIKDVENDINNFVKILLAEDLVKIIS